MANGYHGNQQTGDGVRRGRGSAFCTRCSQCVCGLILLLKVIFCLGIIGLSSYHAAMLVQDQRQYAKTADLYPVTLPSDGHMTLSAYLKVTNAFDWRVVNLNLITVLPICQWT